MSLFEKAKDLLWFERFVWFFTDSYHIPQFFELGSSLLFADHGRGVQHGSGKTG